MLTLIKSKYLFLKEHGVHSLVLMLFVNCRVLNIITTYSDYTHLIIICYFEMA